MKSLSKQITESFDDTKTVNEALLKLEYLMPKHRDVGTKLLETEKALRSSLSNKDMQLVKQVQSLFKEFYSMGYYAEYNDKSNELDISKSLMHP